MTAFVLLIAGCVILLYTYAGYPLLLWVLSRVRPRPTVSGTSSGMTVDVLISAYNESEWIERRIENLLQSTYDAECVRVLIGSDGSTDGTGDILGSISHERVVPFIFGQRRGKAAVLNDLMSRSSADILVFSDANTVYDPDCLSKLAGRFADPGVGGVCGELRLLGDTAYQQGRMERLYWTYESNIKRWEGLIGSTIGGTGAVYAVRRSLVGSLPTHTVIVDDLMQSLNVIARGSRFVYEPGAVAYEYPAPSVTDELRRRIRIGAGNSVCLRAYAGLLKPSRGMVALSFLSHKILRWAIPFILLMMASAFVAITVMTWPHTTVLWIWGLLLAWTAIGFVADRIGRASGPIGMMYYFLAVHIGLGWGLIRGWVGGVEPSWSRIDRAHGKDTGGEAG